MRQPSEPVQTLVRFMQNHGMLSVLPAGSLPPDPAALLGSSAMGSLIAILKVEVFLGIFIGVAAPSFEVANLQKNPLPNVAVFRLGPRAGRAIVTTRMRLATSQVVTALAELSDGSWWSDEASVIVTLATTMIERIEANILG